jgi:hypothetical protein
MSGPCKCYYGCFHDQVDTEWIVIRTQSQEDHNDTPFGRPAPRRPTRRPGGGHPLDVFFIVFLLLISNVTYHYGLSDRGRLPIIIVFKHVSRRIVQLRILPRMTQPQPQVLVVLFEKSFVCEIILVVLITSDKKKKV